MIRQQAQTESINKCEGKYLCAALVVKLSLVRIPGRRAVTQAYQHAINKSKKKKFELNI